MKNELPTYEQVGEELDKTLEGNPELKQCINCVKFNRVTSFCEQTQMKMMPYVPGCAGKWFITARDYLIEKAMQQLKSDAKECDKIEFLLAMALTSANMTTLIIADFERRVNAFYRKEKERGTKSNLRKDLDLADQMGRAMKNISQHLGKIEQQFRFYVQTHLDKIFKKNGIYNAKGYDQLMSDSGEFAVFLFELARVAHHNPDNAEKVYDLMRELRNTKVGDSDNAFCLDDEDIKRYRLKD